LCCSEGKIGGWGAALSGYQPETPASKHMHAWRKPAHAANDSTHPATWWSPTLGTTPTQAHPHPVPAHLGPFETPGTQSPPAIGSWRGSHPPRMTAHGTHVGETIPGWDSWRGGARSGGRNHPPTTTHETLARPNDGHGGTNPVTHAHHTPPGRTCPCNNMHFSNVGKMCAGRCGRGGGSGAGPEGEKRGEGEGGALALRYTPARIFPCGAADRQGLRSLPTGQGRKRQPATSEPQRWRPACSPPARHTQTTAGRPRQPRPGQQALLHIEQLVHRPGLAVQQPEHAQPPRGA
jgi:hypothetical protein